MDFWCGSCRLLQFGSSPRPGRFLSAKDRWAGLERRSCSGLCLDRCFRGCMQWCRRGSRTSNRMKVNSFRSESSDEQGGKMAETAADVLIESIIDWGVDTVFGIPGDGINGIMEALRVRQDRIRFIQVRHEEAAAFMACGYAKYTGRLGCCLATSGPGGIHLLNGLYDAKSDQAPVVAITGQ